MVRKVVRVEQLGLGRYWGERRKGGGRKRDPRSGVSHLKREALKGRFPVHVTMKLKRGLPTLRVRREYVVICEAFDRGKLRPGRLAGGWFRLVEYSVQGDHLHLVVEAKDRTSLSRGVQGLATRVAKALNKLWGRRGKVFAERYHDRILRTPREVRNVLRYVLLNARKHVGRFFHRGRPDCFTSGPWFRGWRDYRDDQAGGWMGPEGPVVEARTWLLRTGWRRHGLLVLAE